MQHYAALLRGINVGGRIVPMSQLRECLERAGFSNVRTYIQSGNVVFDSAKTDALALCDQIEKLVLDTFGYESPTVVVSQEQLKAMVAQAPKNFGVDPKLRYNVAFLKHAVPKDQIFRPNLPAASLDIVSVGPGALYMTTVDGLAAYTDLPKLVTPSVHKTITMRNWATTCKLLAMMES